VAIELKLGRIEEAIAQARGHLAFATESFIGLPLPVAERLCRQRQEAYFRKAGVGLLSVSAQGAAVLVPAVADPNHDADAVLQMHCVERFWRDFTSTLA
jgi:hypothetical protein